MVATDPDQSRHSKFHIPELPLHGVEVDPESDETTITFIHRHRVVTHVDSLRADRSPSLTHIEVEDTVGFVISNGTARELLRCLSESLESPESDDSNE